MIYIEKTTKEKYDILVKDTKSEQRVKCPVCGNDSKRKNPLDLSILGDVGHCHKCLSSFYRDKPMVKQKVYSLPVWNNKTKLSDNVVKWFESRKISQGTLKNMQITEGVEFMPQKAKEVNTIQFNYFKDGKLINVKYRTGDKNFKLFKDGELIFYNIDNCTESEDIIIVEGEMDCLSYVEAGMYYCISVPNGATAKNMDYLDSFVDELLKKKNIYLATDSDGPGIELRNELLRRLGYSRCKNVDFEGCKDANDYMIKYGKEKLRQTIENAKEFPIEGVITLREFKSDFDLLYMNGMEGGVKIGHDNLNKLLTWETGRLAVITGIPGMGKSEIIDEICTQLNIMEGWKTAYFSPENWPLSYHASKLSSKLIGKRFGKETMSVSDKELSADFINENFFFISPKDENYSLDNILDRAEALVQRHGIKILVLDPWNRLEHQIDRGESETNYISKCLTKITNFAQRNDILFILAAHPVKMQKNPSGQYEIPNLYSISGSANFFNKTDYGICVHINNKGMSFNLQSVDIHVQKVKFAFLGTTGAASFKYNAENGRLIPCEIDSSTLAPLDGTWKINNRPFISNSVEEIQFVEDNPKQNNEDLNLEFRDAEF